MLTKDFVDSCNQKINLIEYNISKEQPFCFLDFEVFKHDWLVCFSLDGIHVKNIVNNVEILKNTFINKLNNRILVAYNGNAYDKYIMLALMNGIDPKEVNDNLIYNDNFNFFRTYDSDIILGKDLCWYDPITRNAGSLKTYEACQGEDIYESNVDFNIDTKLTQKELEETIKYCTFDVQMAAQYFYKEMYESFLGHIGLIEQTLKVRTSRSFSELLPKTDASLVGMYLCSEPVVDTTKPTDVITLPDNIILGKYTEQIEEFLKIPITTLRKGSYNDLNAWALKIIDEAINQDSCKEELEKIKNKIIKQIESLKKLKVENLKLLEKDKDKLTKKQREKLDTYDDKFKKANNKLQKLRNNLNIQTNVVNNYFDLKNKLNEYKEKTKEYNETLVQLIKLYKSTKVLIDHISFKWDKLMEFILLDEEIKSNNMYIMEKKSTKYNDILIVYPFEIQLIIKGIPHLFKTGGIHSVYDKPLVFDKDTEKDKNRVLLIADVGSLYPNLMRVFNLCSRAMDDPDAFAQMIFDRIELKKKGDPFAGVLKLILNTTYGCMGSDYNPLRDPTNRLKVCIFGQAAIVDLLDKLEDKILSLEIFQSNTDGIIISCDKSELQETENIIHEWENRTGLEMEINHCSKLVQRDVSNYILIEEK